MRLDPATAERLAAGLLSPDDTPPGYAGVAELLDAARRATAVQDPAVGAVTVAAMQSALAGAGGSTELPWRNKRMLTKRLSVRTAAVASVLVLAGGTAAAAATGSLPAPAQHTAATLLSHVGISVPNTAGTDSGTNGQTTHDGQGKGPDAHALWGLCQAEKAHALHNVHPHSSVFPSASTCTTVTQPSGTNGTTDNGTSDSGTSDSGTSPSGAGEPSDTPVGPPSSVPVGAPTTPPSSTPPADEPPVSTPGHPGSGGRP
ncbi:MAG: hypothetical protein KGJ77_05890 [Acidobacteriota bacterium]|nr:hypothetical protein [Acidobacteriota bacterium]